MSDFDGFLTTCKACTKCRLESGATQVVPGAGNTNTEIMFIGEAPGKQEDIDGVPFVGAAGKFLNVMLESIGLNRDDVYIANMIKCRPPENRDPQEDELEACKDWLTQQLEIINPKIVVTLGRFGMARFFGADKKISQIHSKVRFRGGKAYIALYHPAAALYNGGMRETLLRDFRVIKSVQKMFADGTVPDRDTKKDEHHEMPSLDANIPLNLPSTPKADLPVAGKGDLGTESKSNMDNNVGLF